MGKRYLVAGHEARDHALAWKLAQSPDVETVYISDGNHAVPHDAKLKRLIDYSHEELAEFAADNGIACTVVGDTSDMQDGIVDLFTRRGLPILGAHQAAATLEGSKAFAKAFMYRHNIPTALYRVCSNPEDVDSVVNGCPYPVVMKSDLRVASQNSAIIIQDERQARQAFQDIFAAQEDKDEDAQAHIIIEEFLPGRELSYTILTDGTHWKPLISVRDYKRQYDNDGGCNTGGMGSYAPVPWLTPEIEQRIAALIVEPTLAGLRAEGLSYRGFLYIGIMVDLYGVPRVLEYNTRLGDTEAETILVMWEDDFADVALKAATGSIRDLTLHWNPGVAVSIAVAPRGYPDAPVKAAVGLPFPAPDYVKCFGSIIRRGENYGYTTGPGRVACVSAVGEDASTARKRAYDAAGSLDRSGQLFYRRDIAHEFEQWQQALSQQRDVA